jgi:hypothetical protein
LSKQENAFILAFLIAAPFIGYMLHLINLPMGDLTTIFYPAAQDFLHPYAIEGYINPPWAALLIAPISWIPYELGRVLISLLNMLVTGLVVLKYGGGKSALLIIFTSYPFLFLLSTGSVEWMPMLGLLFNWPILILTKPQSGGLVLLVWFKRTKRKLTFILCIAAFIGLSLLIWWGWPLQMFENIRTLPAALNSPLNKINLWPWGIPFGLATLYFAIMRDDELLAIVATWLLIPHLVYHSLTMGMALLAARYPSLALIMSIVLYIIVVARWHFA